VVSADPSVLFQPCPAIGGSPSYCLPQFATALFRAVGICTRVGRPGAGGLGAACNGRLYGNDPSSLCAPGFLCDQGTCLQWCDLHDPYVSSCTGKNTCIANPALPFVKPPLPLNDAGAVSRAVGVCVQQCDPYNPPTIENGCDPIAASDACTAERPVCKPPVADSDQGPAGLCLNGIANPIAVGSLCNPVADWGDPCVSGAICFPDGSSYVCRQLCDVNPGDGGSTSCQPPTNCVALPCNSYTGLCAHEGVCL
jgi:hypothetical protein